MAWAAGGCRADADRTRRVIRHNLNQRIALCPSVTVVLVTKRTRLPPPVQPWALCYYLAVFGVFNYICRQVVLGLVVGVEGQGGAGQGLDNPGRQGQITG
jgi:hypothetical protein